MPYYPLGNLQYRTDVTSSQHVSAFRQILLDLRHLHAHGVAHRNVKPANVLIVKLSPFTIVISDFNLSKVVASDGLLKIFCGAVGYVAPEVVPVGKNSRSQGYRTSVDIWSTGVLMLQLLYSWPDYASVEHLPERLRMKEWSKLLVKQVGEWEDDPDQVIDIIKNMVKLKPEDRFTAEKCLQRGCDNGLFTRLNDGEIADAAAAEDDVTGVSAGAATAIAISVGEASEDSGREDGRATPTQQSPRRTETGTSNVSEAPTILLGGLSAGDASGEDEPAAGQLTLTGGSNSGPSSRRLKVSHVSSWSLTIGLGRSDSDGGFDLEDGGYGRAGGPVTGVFLRKDRFTGSLRSQATPNEVCQGEEGEQEQEESDIGQGFLTLPELGSGTAEPAELASFERRVLQLQA